MKFSTINSKNKPCLQPFCHSEWVYMRGGMRVMCCVLAVKIPTKPVIITVNHYEHSSK